MSDAPVDEEKILPILKDFAASYPSVQAIYKGENPESGETRYWFLTGPDKKFDFDSEEKLIELELEIFTENEENASLGSLSISPDSAAEQGYVGECLYRK